MSLSMPLHEFSRLRLIAKMGPTGNISLSFKPLDGENPLLHETCVDSSVSLHFNNTCENGVGELSIFVSSSNPICEPTPQSAYVPTDIDTESLARDFVWPDIFSDMLLKVPLPTPANEPYDLANEYSAGLISGDTFFSNQAGIPHSTEVYMNSLSVSPGRDFVASPCSSTSSLGASYPSSPSTLGGLELPSIGEDSDSNCRPKSSVTQSSKRGSPYRKETPRTTRRSGGKQHFLCSFDSCREVFSRKHDRMRHEVMQHSRICEWVCNECRKFFATEKTLAKHKCTSRVGDTRWIAPGSAVTAATHPS